MIEARGVYLFVGQGSKRTEAFIPIAVQTQQNQYAFSENILTASIKKKTEYMWSLSIDTSMSSKAPYRSFKSQIW